MRILWLRLLPLLAASMLARTAAAGVITFSGLILQSTQDGTGPAVNNSDLNHILDSDAYSVSIHFPGAINAPGNYDLTGAGMAFSDAAAPAAESAFGAITLVVAANGGSYDITLLACLTTGTDCSFGNFLSAIFRIPAAGLNLQNVPAMGLDPPHPLDLLEDDGVTDIHGDIKLYSYTADAVVPEPSMGLPLGCGIAALWGGRRFRRMKR